MTEEQYQALSPEAKLERAKAIMIRSQTQRLIKALTGRGWVPALELLELLGTTCLGNAIGNARKEGFRINHNGYRNILDRSAYRLVAAPREVGR